MVGKQTLTGSPRNVTQGLEERVTRRWSHQGTQSGETPVDLLLLVRHRTTADLPGRRLPGTNMATGGGRPLTPLRSLRRTRTASSGCGRPIVDRYKGCCTGADRDHKTQRWARLAWQPAGLVVNSVERAPPAQRAGAGQMTITPTVCNQGTQMGTPRWTCTCQMDDHSGAVGLVDRIRSRPPGLHSLRRPAAPRHRAGAPASVVPYGSIPGGPSSDQTNTVAELRRDNNNEVGGRVGVGERTGLVVTAYRPRQRAAVFPGFETVPVRARSATRANEQGRKRAGDGFFSTDASG